MEQRISHPRPSHLKRYFHDCFKILETGIDYAVSVGSPWEQMSEVFAIATTRATDPFTVSIATGIFFSAVEMLGLRHSSQSDREKLIYLKKFFQQVDKARFAFVIFAIAFAMANRVVSDLGIDFPWTTEGQLKYSLVVGSAFLMGMLFYEPVQNFLGKNILDKSRPNIREILWNVARKSGILMLSIFVAYETLVLPILVMNWFAGEEATRNFASTYSIFRFVLAGSYGIARLIDSSFRMSVEQNEHWQHWEHLLICLFIYSLEEGNLGFNAITIPVLTRIMVAFAYTAMVALMGIVPSLTSDAVPDHGHSSDEEQQRLLQDVVHDDYENPVPAPSEFQQADPTQASQDSHPQFPFEPDEPSQLTNT